jgi:hypothetical protein
VGALVSQLQKAGWIISASRYDAATFGNWYVDLHRGDRTIRVAKDRSQYLLDGSHIEEIEAAGVLRTFDDLEGFRLAFSKWITGFDVRSGDATSQT